MRLAGEKRKELYTELIRPNLPNLEHSIYVEPFGGTFAVNTFLEVRPKKSIYNDIISYSFDIDADVIEKMDYKKLIEKYDSENTFFYLDPPYYGKENFYNLKIRDKNFHIELNNILKNLKGKFILSYESCDFIKGLYNTKEFNTITYGGSKYQLRNEIVIVPSKNS